MSPSNNNGSAKASKPRASKVVVEAAGDVLDEVLSLAGLQVQLGKADFREARARMTRSSAILAVGLAFIMGAVPVLLAGIGLALNELANWPLWAALLASGVATLLIAGLACWGAVMAFGHSLKVFERSQEQLALNIEKIRTVLRRDRAPRAAARTAYEEGETPPPHQPR